MNATKRIAALLLCGALLLSASACSQQALKTAGPESSSSASSVSSREESSAVSSENSKPESSSQASSEAPSSSEAAPSTPQKPTVTDDDSSAGTEYLPSIETGSENFQKAFAGNAIDSQFELEYSRSTSATLMVQACNDAAQRWKNMIDVAYQSVLDLSDDGQRESVKETQDQWAAVLDQKLQEIRDDAGDGADAPLEIARGAMLLYRERAAELCSIQYANDGTLPSFEVVSGDEEVKG